MPYADVNGARLQYRDVGAEHTLALLLIHGFPLDHRMWRGQFTGLGRTMRIIAPDLRGHGRSSLGPAPLTMDQHADDLAALLDHLAVRQVAVAGLSMGGYVAFALWRRHAERVRALALLDTRPEPDSPSAQEARNTAIARVRKAGASAYTEEMLPRLLAPASLANPRIVTRAREIMASQPAEGIAAALAALRDRPDSTPTLRTIGAPVLVMVGEDDAVTPPAVAEAMATQIPQAQLAVIPRAGHLSPLENPRRVNQSLRVFVNGLPQR